MGQEIYKHPMVQNGIEEKEQKMTSASIYILLYYIHVVFAQIMFSGTPFLPSPLSVTLFTRANVIRRSVYIQGYVN